MAKWIIIILSAVIVGLLGLLVYSNISGNDVFPIIESFPVFSLPPVIEQSGGDDIWELTDIIIHNGTISFIRGDNELNITPTVIVAGDEYIITDYLHFSRERTDYGWKWGANITIPDTPLGEQIANHLEEVRFNIQSNFDLRVLRGRLAFQQLVDSTTNDDLTITERYIRFDFSDIVERYMNLPHYMIVNSRTDVIAVIDVRDITFHAGQTIELDPTVSLANYYTYPSIETNATKEPRPFVHVSLNDTGTVLYMPLDLATTTLIYDYSDYGNDGTVTNAVYTEGGVVNGAYKFDGDGDFIQTGSAVPSLVDGGTISVWANVTDTSTTQVIIAHSKESSDRMTIVLKGGTIAGEFYNGGWNVKSGNVATGFHHYVFTWDGSNPAFYIDGVAQSGTTTLAYTSSLNYVYIGKRGGATPNYFNGTIDEVMIMTHVLNSTQVTELYNSQSYKFKQPSFSLFLPALIDQDGTFNTINLSTNSSQPTGTSISARVYAWNGTYNDTIDGIVDDNIVAWWHFNNRSGYENDTYAFDYSGHQYKGVVEGDTHYTKSGLLDGSFYFDGTGDYIDFKDEDELEMDGDWSFSIWINSTNDAYAYFVRDDNFWARYNPDGDKVQVLLVNSSGKYYPNSNIITLNQWHHVVATCDNASSNFSLYVDGDIDFSYGGIPCNATGNVAFTLSYSGNQFWNGSLDEAIVWNKTLNSLDVQNLYARGRLIYERPSNWETIADGDNMITQFDITTFTQGISLEFNFTTDDYHFNTPLLVGGLVTSGWAKVPESQECLYGYGGSGHFLIGCQKNCTVNANYIVQAGYNVKFRNRGNVKIRANITNFAEAVVEDGCEISVFPTGGLEAA